LVHIYEKHENQVKGCVVELKVKCLTLIGSVLPY